MTELFGKWAHLHLRALEEEPDDTDLLGNPDVEKLDLGDDDAWWSVAWPEPGWFGGAGNPNRAWVACADGYEWEPLGLTAAQCRAFAAALVQAADRIEGSPLALLQRLNQRS